MFSCQFLEIGWRMPQTYGILKQVENELDCSGDYEVCLELSYSLSVFGLFFLDDSFKAFFKKILEELSTLWKKNHVSLVEDHVILLCLNNLLSLVMTLTVFYG